MYRIYLLEKIEELLITYLLKKVRFEEMFRFKVAH